MRKKYLLILTILLLIPLTVFASDYPQVLTLTTDIEDNIINFSGTTEVGSYAVMCKLIDSEGEVIDRLSVSVDSNEFSGIFITLNPGEYQILCANYEGGQFKQATAVVDAEPESYTVTFNTNGGSEIENAVVLSGQKVSKPSLNPTNGDKIFAGWYEDDTFVKEFDFDTLVTSDIEIFALWIEQEWVKVSFDTRVEQGIEPVVILSGQKVSIPTDDLRNGDKEFNGWYEDDTFTKEFDFNTPVTSDITLYALWIDPVIETTTYVVEDDKGNSATFVEESGHSYSLTIINYFDYSKEDILSLAEISEQEYDETLNAISEGVKAYGELVSLLEITVTSEQDFDVTNIPVTIKIRLTDEMNKYNILKLIYLDDDLNVDNPVSLTIEDGYATGILPHLSTYILVGSNDIVVSAENEESSTTIPTESVSNPLTNDNIYTWYGLLAISILGLTTMLATSKFKKKCK